LVALTLAAAWRTLRFACRLRLRNIALPELAPPG
jgi:hypothetical protein